MRDMRVSMPLWRCGGRWAGRWAGRPAKADGTCAGRNALRSSSRWGTVRTMCQKTWYEEKYERDSKRERKPRNIYTGRKSDDSVKVQLVQWYPGHIAKAEKQLQERLKAVDVVIELRDSRAAFATEHPEVWCRDKPRILVLNRVDMISKVECRKLEEWFSKEQNAGIIPTNGKTGQGVPKLLRRAVSFSKVVNEKRTAKGLLPREVRAAVVGFPNVGKSAIINRLLQRKACASANTPGLTKQLRWVRAGEDLYLLDSPGVLPARLLDQRAAQNLAICNDIGKASYLQSSIASVFIERVKELPARDEILENIRLRYKLSADGLTGEEFVDNYANKIFNGHIETAGARILKDYSRGALGKFALELPPS